jgi:serine/threonine protein kinase
MAANDEEGQLRPQEPPRSPARRADASDARAAARAPLASLRRVASLGEGAFSSVDLVTLPSPRSGGCAVSGGRSAALKRIKSRRDRARSGGGGSKEPPTPRTAGAILRSEREAHARAAESPFVAHAFALKQGRPASLAPAAAPLPPPLALLLEYHPGGDLARVLAKRRADHARDRAVLPYLSEAEARFVAGCALLALEHLHVEARVIHRDCKPANLFVGRGGYVVLGDLGCAAVLPRVAAALSSSSSPSSSCVYRGRHCAAVSGTRGFMAPEVVRAAGVGNKGAEGVKSYGAAVDLFSLGVALYELASGAAPSADGGGCGSAALSLAAEGGAGEGGESGVESGESSRFPAHFSAPLRSLLSGLLSADPLARPTAAQAQGHCWFDGFDFAALRARTLPAPKVLAAAALAATLAEEQQEP